jgi:predicted NUDIX family NTP pyrophosphohydrolase
VAKHGAISAGVLVWRRTAGGELEVLIVHPGGPFFAKKDLGGWSIPKGECEIPTISDEVLRETALRELVEETGLLPETPMVALGRVRQKSGKIVHAYAMEADAELPPGHRPPQVRLEWPRGSMREIAFPEVDDARFVPLAVARDKLNLAQVELLDRLVAALNGRSF